MIRILDNLPKAPENLADFMTEKEIRHRLDLTLAKGCKLPCLSWQISWTIVETS